MLRGVLLPKELIMRNRPIGITLLALFQAMVMGLGMMGIGALSLLLQFASLESLSLVAGRDDSSVETSVLLTYGLVLLLGGLVMLIGAVGLWLMQRWGWFTSITIWTVNLVVTITQMTIGREDLILLGARGVFPPVPRLILCVLVIIFLLLPQVSQSFKKTQGSS
jgi:hypothetical protein